MPHRAVAVLAMVALSVAAIAPGMSSTGTTSTATPWWQPQELPKEELLVVFDEQFVGWLDAIWQAHMDHDAAALWAAADQNLPLMRQWVAAHEDQLPEDDRYCEQEVAGIGQSRPVNDAGQSAGIVTIYNGDYGSVGGVCITGTGDGVYSSSSRYSFGAAGGVFIDLGGDDTYTTEMYAFGIMGGLFLDLGGQDQYKVNGGNGFGFLGGLFIDASGNDEYILDGSGGFGNNGAFIEGGGSDVYRAGASAFAYGTLVPAMFLELGGDDTYITTGVGHFGLGSTIYPALSMFIDVQGNDHYIHSGNQAFGHKGAFAFDLSGDDVYDVRGAQSLLFGSSVPGLFNHYPAGFIDAGGEDFYLHDDPTDSFGSTPADGDSPLTYFMDLDGNGPQNGQVTIGGQEGPALPGLGDALAGAGLPPDFIKMIEAEAFGNDEPTASFTWSPPQPTDLDNIHFQDTSTDPDGTVIEWLWDFGDGSTSREQHPQHRFKEDGAYLVTLTVTDDLGATHQHEETMDIANVPPTATIQHDAPANADTSTQVTFQSLAIDPDGEVVAHEWDFGDGTTAAGSVVTHWFDDGLHMVTLTVRDDDGATGSATTNVSIANIPPVASIDIAPGPWTSQDTVLLQANASDPDGSIVAYAWQVDGYHFSGPVVQHTFGSPGVKNIRLTVEDDDGGTTDAVVDLTILNTPPLASFTHHPDIASTVDPVRFIDTSFDTDGQIVAWHWDFGDGFSNEPSPSWSFATRGNHSVRLTVTDDAGDQSTAQRIVSVENKEPVANYTIEPEVPLQGQNIYLNSTSRDDDGEITSLLWTLPDGGQEIGEKMVLQLEPGTHRIRLTVTDNEGAQGTTEQIIAIGNRAPTVGFTLLASEVLRGQSVHVSVTVRDDDGDIASWTLDWGDGTVVKDGQSTTMSHHYGDTGLHTIVLTATDDSGATSSKQRHVRVLPQAPEASFTAPEVVLTGQEVSFVDTSSDDVGITSWRWDFGDGQSSKSQSPVHKYEDDGVYVVQLTVMDAEGETDIAKRSVTVQNRPPTVSDIEAPDVADVATEFHLSVAAADPDGSVRVHWDFGDGNEGAGQSVTHAFSSTGTFRITAVAVDDDGAQATVEHTMLIGNRAPVVAIIGPEVPRPGEAATWRAEAHDPDGDAIDITWQINGTVLHGEDISLRLPPGEHVVHVTVTDAHGASSTHEQVVEIEAASEQETPVQEVAKNDKKSPGLAPVLLAAAICLARRFRSG